MQRLEPVAGCGCTHADAHQAVVGPGRKRSLECWLYGVQRTSGTLNPDGAARLTASPSPGLAVSTHCSPSWRQSERLHLKCMNGACLRALISITSPDMNSVQEYLSDRQQLLAKNKMGMLLNPADVSSTNPWFMVFIPNLNALVKNLSAGSMRFCISAESKVQACAIHDDQAIVLTAGMFDLLCNLASSIVSRGIYPALGTTSKPDWSPDVNNNLRSVRDFLTDSSFNWVLKPSWSDDAERLELFFQLLCSMVRFVVLHEAGHLWHQHGERRKEGYRFEIDALGSKSLLEPKQALESQARELLADQFAFRSLLRVQHEEILHPPTRQSENNVRSALLSSPSEEIAFCLLTIYFYFYAVDQSNWDINNTHLYSHPPAPFRLKAILCDLLEFGALGMSPSECQSVIPRANVIADAVISTTFQRFPDLNWMSSMNDNRLLSHFTQLCDEIPNWQRAL